MKNIIKFAMAAVAGAAFCLNVQAQSLTYYSSDLLAANVLAATNNIAATTVAASQYPADGGWILTKGIGSIYNPWAQSATFALTSGQYSPTGLAPEPAKGCVFTIGLALDDTSLTLPIATNMQFTVTNTVASLTNGTVTVTNNGTVQTYPSAANVATYLSTVAGTNFQNCKYFRVIGINYLGATNSAILKRLRVGYWTGDH